MKKFLVVIKDNLEYKNFVDYFHLIDKNKNKIYVTSPVAIDQNFIKDIKQLSENIKVIDIWDECSIRFSDKVKYWIKRQFFYLENSLISESCFQKFWLHIGFSEANVLSGRNRFIQQKISKFLVYLTPKFLYRFIYNLKYNSHLTNHSKKYNFDYIVFMRPDSAINILFYNTFKTQKNKVITFVRNYDTPALKGIFTVKSDITLLVSNNLKKLLKKIHHKNFIGFIKVITKSSNKVDHKLKNILYCTSHPKFFPQENIVLENLIKKLAYGYKLKIRLHPSDYMERYNINKSFFLNPNEHYIQYHTKKNKMKFHSLDTINKQTKDFIRYDTLITHSSTVVKDAFDSGIKNLYFIIDGNEQYKYIFNREHINLLTEELNIKSIDFEGNFLND